MTIISIAHDPSTIYPTSDYYSPEEFYPEYPFKDSLSRRNDAYRLIRQCLRHSEANFEHYEQPNWNPLGKWINRGDRVFGLPNFVYRRGDNESLVGFFSKCTNASVVRAVIDYVSVATGGYNNFHCGNSPIQSCD